ncbi:MAG TPA: transglycosylase domain-containing protein [Lachnospiraceae bacterium]|nr:transglycosylase domain-containing protein [Lachnospiraceae bacterium]
MNYGKKGIRTRQKSLNSKTTKFKKMFTLTMLKALLICFVSLGILGLSLGIGTFKGMIASAPSISNIDVSPSGFATMVYDSSGHEIIKLVAADSNRTSVTMDKIPKDLAHAFVAIEDERFYEHNGIDIKGILRASIVGIKNKGNFTEGASTITQQLLKNNVFDNWMSEDSFAEKLKRKIQEQYLAIELTKTMSKDKVLENYMNTINLGQNTLGIQAASLRYFNKPVYQLNLSECSVIAGITQNPSRYNPIVHPDNNAERRAKVLANMLDQGYIDQAEYDEAMADDVYSRIQTVNASISSSSIYTYFVDELTEQVIADLIAAGYNATQAENLLFSGGLNIYSTQDSEIQAICDEVFSNEDNYPANTKWLLSYALTILKANGEYENHSNEMYQEYFTKLNNKRFDGLYSTKDLAYEGIAEYTAAVLSDGDEVFTETIELVPQPQVSLTIEDQKTGHVVAMIGGRGIKEQSLVLNRASNTPRQPGSTFKIVSTYAPALDSAGLTLANIQNDAPFNYQDGTPVSNWYGNSTWYGLSSLRFGIEQSLNIVAVKTLTQITPQLGYDYLLSFGFSTLVQRQVTNDGRILGDINQSLALGGITKGVTNMELNASYAAIANGGTYIKPILYTKVVDSDGNVILDNTHPETRQVIKETTAFLLTDAMVDVVTKGTGTPANFAGMAIAGKTGTTTAYRDVWFAGYTPYYTATTWVGYDNNVSLKSESEKVLAKTLWRATMSRIHEDLPNKSFTMPSGIVTATVCSKSGKLPIEGICDATLVTEYFAEGTVPTESCDVHYSGMVCAYSGLPASEDCPFKIPGILELTPLEHSSLISGSTTIAAGELPAVKTNTCPHTAEFFLNPDAQAIINQQMATLPPEILAIIQGQHSEHILENNTLPQTISPLW